MRRAREHLRSHIIGYVALFIALAGTASALPGKNTVDSGDIRNGQVKTADIRNDNVRGADIRTGAVGSSDVTNGALTGVDVAENGLTGSDINESTLGGIDADTFDGRALCNANFRISVDPLTIEDNYKTETACTLGPISINAYCEADTSGEIVRGQVRLKTTANQTAVAVDVTPAEINAGDSRAISGFVFDSSANNIPVVGPSVPFSAWTLGGTQVVGQAAVRANSYPDNTRVCDFAILATG